MTLDRMLMENNIIDGRHYLARYLLKTCNRKYMLISGRIIGLQMRQMEKCVI